VTKKTNHEPLPLKRGNLPEANTGASFSEMERERMARRRFQNPTPRIAGKFWYLNVWQNMPGVERKRQRIKLAPASTPEREVLKIAAEKLRPLNQGLISTGSAVNFAAYVTDTYILTDLPLLAKGVQSTYRGMIHKHLTPAFENSMLRDLTPLTLQRFFSSMPARGIAYPTMIKIRDTLSSILRSAVRYEFLDRNPLEKLQLPADKRGTIDKPLITPAEFQSLLLLMPEPYASAVYVATWTGLRVSELSALKWKCILEESISVKQSYSRGDWSSTKTAASAATIAVEPHVIARIHRLKSLTVDVRAGLAVRRHRVVKSDGPEDLVFQSVWKAKPLNASNILKRFITPAAEKLQMGAVDWRCLRRSCATWMARAGANPKDIQGQMRHSRISTTMDIYAQFVPEGQKRAARKLTEYVEQETARVANRVPLVLQ
jgi:integrase